MSFENETPVSPKPTAANIDTVEVPEFWAALKTMVYTTKNEVEMTLRVRDFPVDLGKDSIFGNSDGKGSLFGILAYIKNNKLLLASNMHSVVPPVEESDEEG